eukprot:7375161-Pyramimonas_sp.AAC.1
MEPVGMESQPELETSGMNPLFANHDRETANPFFGTGLTPQGEGSCGWTLLGVYAPLPPVLGPYL